MARFTLIGLIGAPLLVGCAVATVTPSPTATLPPTPTVTVAPDTSTPSPTATITLTPAPTLSGDEANKYIRELIRDNGGCDLPCFDGGRLAVGVTSAHDAEAYLNILGGAIDWDNTYTFAQIPPPPHHTFDYYDAQLALARQDGLLRQITLEAETGQLGVVASHLTEDWRPRYGWDRILAHNGIPSEIDAGFLRGGSGVTPYYGLTLIYRQSGMLITYQGPAHRIGGPRIRACLRFDQVTRIYLRLSPDHAPDGSDLGPSPTPPGLVASSRPYTLYEQTGMSPERFYEVFKNPDAVECVTSEETHFEWSLTPIP